MVEFGKSLPLEQQQEINGVLNEAKKLSIRKTKPSADAISQGRRRGKQTDRSLDGRV